MTRPKRNHRSARQAGSRFERLIADYLAERVDDRIDRRVRTGVKDKGDISGLRHMGMKIAVECKNTTRMSLGTWMTEAHTAMGNDDAGLGIVVHKRHGKGQAGDQWVTMTVDDLVALLTGEPRSLP